MTPGLCGSMSFGTMSRKKSSEITRAYLVTHSPPPVWWRGVTRPVPPDMEKALRAARALKRSGYGSIVKRSRSFTQAAVVVVLRASKARHRQVLRQVRAREWIKVQAWKNDGRSRRSATKGRWVYVVSCCYCGVGVGEVSDEGQAQRAANEKCRTCAAKTPLELLADVWSD